MTTASEVRTGLQDVTKAAQSDLRAVGAAASDPAEARAALFAATPLIVSDYAPGSAALALDWFDELRDLASPPGLFAPRPVVTIDDEAISAAVAVTTEALYEIQRGIERDFSEALEESMRQLELEVQKEVARGFWDTMTVNSDEDPDAVGWQRFARPGGCKFCVMLAERGAVYDEVSVNFAAHTSCHCVVGPSYDADAPRASVMQYVASSRNRTPEQQAALREYLNHHYPDAPG